MGGCYVPAVDFANSFGEKLPQQQDVRCALLRFTVMPLSETDRRLIKDLLSRQDGAWETFVHRFSGLVIQVIRHTAHAHSFRLSGDDEEDLCADVFATLIERRMATLRSF